MGAKMKLCKDCEHYARKLPNVHGEDLCLRSLERDPVHGERAVFHWAYEQRKTRGLLFNRDRCGPDARYFEAREKSE